VTPGKTLSRDFKHVRKQAPGSQQFTGWMGLGVGLAVGLSIALGVFVHYRKAAAPVPEPQAMAAKTPASAEAAEEVPPSTGEMNYSFYDELPKQEVEVPEDRSPTGAPLPRLAKGSAVLQVGSFKQFEQAEKMQAKLAFHGIESKIQRFPLDDETWYRVRIGPIETVQDLEAIRAKLVEAEVEAQPVTTTTEMPPP
jgi:cell division protein FtsN